MECKFGFRWCSNFSIIFDKSRHRNELRALVVELVDTRDLKSLGVRAVPVQVRPGAPSIKVYIYVANATLAQLVERNLAKVEVTSSNLVCRSKLMKWNVSSVSDGVLTFQLSLISHGIAMNCVPWWWNW